MTYEEIHWRSWGPIGVRSQHFFCFWASGYLCLEHSLLPSEQVLWTTSKWSSCLSQFIFYYRTQSLFHSKYTCGYLYMPDNMSKTECCLTVLEVKQNRETITKGSHNEESTNCEWKPGFWKEETWRCEGMKQRDLSKSSLERRLS